MKTLEYPKEKRVAFAKYAELAWASYSTGFNEGMFGNEEKQWGFNEQRKYLTKQEAQKIHQLSYKRALTSSIFTFYNDTRVDFGDKQAEEFIHRYEILAFIDRADSGFSATLFRDTHNNEKILAFRGLDIFNPNLLKIPNIQGLGNSLKADVSLKICENMIDFYKAKIQPLQDKYIVVGHSFGGYLAQLFTLMYPEIIKETYTFSSIGVVPDWSNGIMSFVLDSFSPDSEMYSTLQVTQKHKDSIQLQNNLIYLTKPNKELDNFLPYYLKAKSLHASDHIDSYNLSGSPLPVKSSMQKFASKLFYEIQTRDNDTFLACNLQTNVLGSQQMTMREENGITPISIKYFEQIKTLSQRIKRADATLPSPLTQSQIHQIQTSVEAIYRINVEKGYVFFGKHILSTTYPHIPIDKGFKPTANPYKAYKAYRVSQKDLTKDRQAKNELKKIVKSTIKTNIATYILVIVTIEDIYNALAILAHIDDTAMSSAELMQFLSQLYQPSIMETKLWNLS